MLKTHSVSSEDLFQENVFIDGNGRFKSCFSWRCTNVSYGQCCESPTFEIKDCDISWNLRLSQCRNKSEYKLLLCSSEKEDVSMNFRYFANDRPLPEIAVYNVECDERVISHLRGNVYGTNIVVKYLEPSCHVKPVDHCITLIQDMSRMLSDAKFSDFVIVTEDGSMIPVHRNVLSARSSVFSAMLDSDMAEKNSGCLKIDDFSTQTVKDMINYLYTDRLPKLTFEIASGLLKIADKYDLKTLKQTCGESLKINLTVANTPHVLLLAETYREDSLKWKVLDFISENRTSFNNRQMFSVVAKQNPDLLLDVIESMADSCDSDME